jgi:hypothetical protein
MAGTQFVFGQTWRLLTYALLLSFGCQVTALAQQAWDFGGHSFLITAQHAAPLMERAFGRSGLTSMAVLGRVGGINLEGKAVLDASLRGQPPQLRYEPAQPDGHRLSVTMNGVTYHPYIADWKLKPITLLADSPFTADVSLFGDGPDRNKYYYIQYHPALKDTLLGLRLLQADVMLIDPENLSRVPELGGRAVLGEGEQLPDEAKSRQAAMSIQDEMLDHPIQSWILTDINTSTQITIQDNRLKLQAAPYYYFWTTDQEKFRFQLKALKDSAAAATTQEEKNRVRADAVALLLKLRSLEDHANDNEQPIALTDISNILAQQQTRLWDLNPTVWAAVLQTTRFAAFFRVVKSTDPLGWRAFVTRVSQVTIYPAVQTPTQWERQ